MTIETTGKIENEDALALKLLSPIYSETCVDFNGVPKKMLA